LLQFFSDNRDYILIALGILLMLITFLVRRLLARRFSKYIIDQTFKDKAQAGTVEQIFEVLYQPISNLIMLVGFYVAVKFLPLKPNQEILVQHLFRTGFIGIIALCFYNLSKKNILVSEELKALLNIEPILVPFVSKLVRVLVIAIALVMIASEWGYDVNGLMAGLGLGGLAIALAAQNLLSNLFGGFVIITDKPFSVGDWISTPQVEGIVEDMNFRSTRIRTFAQALVTIPNSTLANAPITNWSRMGKRQLSFSLRLDYSTTRQQIEKCVNRIKELLINHPGIHKDPIIVNFDKFNESSLDIFIYCFTITKVWIEFQEVKQDINLKIMKILEEEGVSLAVPIRNLYLQNSKLPSSEEV